MINPMNRHSPIRMMGMSSGMDTDFIIQQSMRIHQMKIDSRMRSRTNLEWKQQMHTGIRDELRAFRQSFLTTIGPNAMMSSNVYNASTTKITGKNAGAVTIKTNSSSMLGNLTINSVTRLAQGARATASNVTGASGTGLSSTARLGNILGGNIEFTDDTMRARTGPGDDDFVEFKRDADGNLKLADGGTSVTFTTHTDDVTGIQSERWTGGGVTLQKLNGNIYSVTPSVNKDGEPVMINAINKDGKSLFTDADNNIYYKDGDEYFKQNGDPVDAGFDPEELEPLQIQQETLTAISLQSWGTADVQIGVGDGTPTTVTLHRNMTVNDMVREVNQKVSGVTMAYDALKDEFRIETNERRDPLTGEVLDRTGETLTLSGQLFEELGLITGGTQTFDNAQNAEFYVNGEINPRVSFSNSFEFRRLNITLNNTFNELTPTTTNIDDVINVEVARDVDAAVNKIKSFIDSYNTIISKLEKLLRERKTSSEAGYAPLTDEEKSQMSEKQIEEWESIAKKGLLRNDNALNSMVTSLRRALFDEIEGVGLSPSQIGITTGGYFDGTGGMIVLDEDRLREALEEDPEKVMNVFMANPSSTDYKERGLLYRMSDIMGGYLSDGATNTLDSLDRSIRQANAQIQRLQEKMWREEDRLYKQFAAMETALSNMQSQGDWFSAMLGGMK